MNVFIGANTFSSDWINWVNFGLTGTNKKYTFGGVGGANSLKVFYMKSFNSSWSNQVITITKLLSQPEVHDLITDKEHIYTDIYNSCLSL